MLRWVLWNSLWSFLIYSVKQLKGLIEKIIFRSEDTEISIRSFSSFSSPTSSTFHFLFALLPSSPHGNNTYVRASSSCLHLLRCLGCRGDRAPAAWRSHDSKCSEVHTHLLDGFRCFFVCVLTYNPSVSASATAGLLLKAASPDIAWFGLDLFASNLDLDRPTRLHHRNSAQFGLQI